MDKSRNCSSGAISPLIRNIFNISSQRSQINCSFVKFGCSFGIFLNSAHLLCRSTDISKCFRGSLRLRDNESRLYLCFRSLNRPYPVTANCKTFLRFWTILPISHHFLQSGLFSMVTVFSVNASDIFRTLSVGACLIA